MENTDNAQTTPQAEPRSDTAVGSNPLLACPFCGGEYLELRRFQSDPRYGRVHCLRCTASGPLEDVTEVIEWNHRHANGRTEARAQSALPPVRGSALRKDK